MLTRVLEQPEGTKYLRKIVSGDLRIPLLLVGPSGVGRKFSAIEATRELFSGGDPNSFHSVQIDKGVHPDLVILEAPEDKDLGIDPIRDLIEQAGFLPMLAPLRVVILDGVDTMTMPAANAFLKTLEEPPQGTLFLLLAQNLNRVLPTIRSRCGIVRYSPLSEQRLVERLSQLTSDPVKALVYARLSEGSLGRAIQLLGSGRLSLRNSFVDLLRKTSTKDVSSIFSAVDDITELPLGLRFLDHLLRDLTMLPHDEQRLSNLDIVGDLRDLRRTLGAVRIERLVTEFRTVQRHQHKHINLAFHVKTALASAALE